MEVILIESVMGLGRPGDQVKVKDGYARNYLFPGAKAVPVSADVMRNLGKLKQRAQEEERAMLSSMEEIKAKLDGQILEIAARATEEGHLFGSVTDKDVQAALESAGWNLPPRCVRMDHLKEAGEAEVEVHLYGEISAQVKVSVVPVDQDGNVIETGGSQAEEGAAEGEGESDTEGETEAPADENASTT